jgi:hypothetical protein
MNTREKYAEEKMGRKVSSLIFITQFKHINYLVEAAQSSMQLDVEINV